MNIVLTGGLGHIGSRFLERTPEILPNSHITLIDDFSTQRYCSLFNLPKNLSYTLIEGRVQDLDLNEILKDQDYAIHLGATTDAAGTAKDPDLIFKNNLPATEHLAKACIQNNTALIFPSSTSVYGVQEGVVDETCENVKPQSPYADCKIQEENLIRSYGNQGLNYCLARLGTIFGTSKGMRFHTAVNKFCWQAAMGKPISVWTTAMDQKRPYLGLDDACEFLAFVINNKFIDNGLYNVVTENYTVRNVVEAIQEHIPSLNVEYVDSPIMNQLSYHVSNEKLKIQGFEFHDNLHSSILETLRLLKPNLKQ